MLLNIIKTTIVGVKKLTVIACPHTEKIHDGGEVICAKCGMVLNDFMNDDREMYTPISKTNLFDRKEIGSRNYIPDTKEGERIKKYLRSGIYDGERKKSRDNLSRFSNVCEKLSLSQGLIDYSWTLFTRAIKTQPVRYTAESVCWAIFCACKKHAHPLSVAEIQNVVRMIWGRKEISHMTSILYDHMHLLDDESENDEEYYFKLNMRKMLQRKKFYPEDMAECKARAWFLFNNVFVNGNMSARTRRAIQVGFDL